MSRALAIVRLIRTPRTIGAARTAAGAQSTPRDALWARPVAFVFRRARAIRHRGIAAAVAARDGSTVLLAPRFTFHLTLARLFAKGGGRATAPQRATEQSRETRRERTLLSHWREGAAVRTSGGRRSPMREPVPRARAIDASARGAPTLRQVVDERRLLSVLQRGRRRLLPEWAPPAGADGMRPARLPLAVVRHEHGGRTDARDAAADAPRATSPRPHAPMSPARVTRMPFARDRRMRRATLDPSGSLRPPGGDTAPTRGAEIVTPAAGRVVHMPFSRDRSTRRALVPTRLLRQPRGVAATTRKADGVTLSASPTRVSRSPGLHHEAARTGRAGREAARVAHDAPSRRPPPVTALEYRRAPSAAAGTAVPARPTAAAPPAAAPLDLDRLSREVWKRLDARARLEAERRGRA
jgi:hypothetical protein